MPAEGVHRPAWAEISKGALAHNVQVLKRVVGAARLCAVVKANGYGHGAVLVARAALEGGADLLAVAVVDEGLELREAGVSAPILLLAEIQPSAIEVALAHDLTLTIGSMSGAEALVEIAERLGGRHLVHLKIDTGMHRMGVALEDAEKVLDRLLASPNVEVEGLYSHFSVADGQSEDDRAYTALQIARFDELVARLDERGVTPRVVHLANSAGALAYPSSRRSMVRIGIALYGYAPSTWLAEQLAERGEHLEPVLTLRAEVSATRRLEAGERPSYQRRRALLRAATVVTVPFGYADGFPRRLFDAGAEVLIGGQRRPLAGVVTMDQLVIEVGDDEFELGEDVVLIGSQGDQSISAEEWAERAGTITWEVLCGIGARVPRVLVE